MSVKISRLGRAAFPLLFLFLLTGCFDTKQEFTINPDGSGKVIHECRFSFLDLNPDKLDVETRVRAEVRKLIEKSKGVEVWRDVSFSLEDDGRLYFRGTAYFRRLSDLDIASQAPWKFDWHKNGNEAVLGARGNTSKSPPPNINLSSEELAKKLRQARISYQNSRPMLVAGLQGLKQETILHLPGRISENSALEIIKPGTLKFEFKGTKLLEILDQRIRDDEWLKKDILAGATNPYQLGDYADLFGQPLRAVIKGTSAPLFDYAAEVGSAQKEFPAILKQLGLAELNVHQPPAAGERLKNVKVIEIGMVKPTPNSDGSYTLTLSGELSGSVVSLVEGTLETAIADDGSSLLRPLQSRIIAMPKVFSDGTSVTFKVPLKFPRPGVQGVKEISGFLSYTAKAGTKEIDLGFTELKTGARGAELGAEIQLITTAAGQPRNQQLQLKLDLRREQLTGVSLLVNDVRIPLEQRGFMGGHTAGTFLFESKMTIPANARLMATVFDQVQTFNAPFRLENVTLLGDSLSPATPGAETLYIK